MSSNPSPERPVLRFNLDRRVNLSFYAQIKGQLLSAIYCGKIEAGDRLPTIRELADDLGVNYKTIHKIYRQLAEENLIEIVQGSGAFLKQRTGKDSYDDMRRRAIMKQLGEVSEKAKNLGLSPQRFAHLLESYATGRMEKTLRLAVVDHEEEAHIFARELRLRTGAEALPVALSEPMHPESLREICSSDYVLTTSWHLEDVEKLAKDCGKRVFEIKPSHQVYMEILSEARTRNIAIVIQDERTMHASWEVFMNIYRPSTEKKFWIAPIDRTEMIDKIVREADLIFVSPLCWEEMRKRTPPEKEIRTYEKFISEETINLLKELQLIS